MTERKRWEHRWKRIPPIRSPRQSGKLPAYSWARTGHRRCGDSDFQRFLDEDGKIALIMAGLPHAVTSLPSGRSASFLRRAARFEPQAPSDYEVEEALVRTMGDGGKSFEPDALEAAIGAIRGFPFMLQLVGCRAWRMAGHSGIVDISSANAAAGIARKELGRRVYEAVWFELSEADKSFLLAMTKDPEVTRQADLPGRLNKASGHASRYKKRLLQQGIIQERSKGLLEFCLPGFKEHLLERIAEERGLQNSRSGFLRPRRGSALCDLPTACSVLRQARSRRACFKCVHDQARRLSLNSFAQARQGMGNSPPRSNTRACTWDTSRARGTPSLRSCFSSGMAASCAARWSSATRTPIRASRSA